MSPTGECPLYCYITGLMRQIRCAYSRMLRSLEKMPMLSVLSTALRCHSSGWGRAHPRRPAPRHTPRSPPARRTARPSLSSRSTTGLPSARLPGEKYPASIISSVFVQLRIRPGDLGRRVPAPAVGRDLLGRQAEDEDVLRADLLADLDVGAVERADRERAIQRQLHVAGARRFHARRRDLLREIRRRHDALRERHVVVGQEQHPELPGRPRGPRSRRARRC